MSHDTAVRSLLDRLHDVGGFLVRYPPDRIKLYDAAGNVSADLRAELRAHKAELLTYLQGHPCEKCGRFAFPIPGIVCFWCRR